MKVFIVGIGMGNPDTLTLGAKRAIESSELLIGAKRLLEPFEALECELVESIRPTEIAEVLSRSHCKQASVLMSGDVGFYSGATGLYGKLDAFDVEVVPGISSVVYFCAKMRTTWQDVELVSAHGRDHDAVGAIQSHRKTFCITGGKTKVEDICSELVERGLGHVHVAAGERLSYEDERIVQGSAQELSGMSFADLSVMLAINENPIESPYGAPAMRDDDFLRGKAPMTKEEIRAIVIAKLRIEPGHLVWDVGAGTGSVSIEAALAARAGRVFAIEKKPEALELLAKNSLDVGTANIKIVPGEAPQALEGLPAPDRVFIGGSSGNIAKIIEKAVEANPAVRICATAITLETQGELLSCLSQHGISGADIVQVSVARSQELGSYHLMRAENPILIVTADFGKADDR